MNVALIFAGGTGQRMNTKTTPKQFLKLHGKPIIIYTIEQFETHPEIDGIVVVCLESWIPYLKKLIQQYSLGKVVDVVPGGSNGQESIYNGVWAIHERYDDDTVVLVHDGVRPLVDADTIQSNIACAREKGSAITVIPATETVVIRTDDNVFGDIMDRKKCRLARAPQSFLLGQLFDAHTKARQLCKNEFIDSAHLMNWYGIPLFEVEGKPENIKITSPTDFYIFRAIVDARENSQIFGL